MKRKNLYKAQTIINQLEHLEKVSKAIEEANRSKFLDYTGLTVKLSSTLEYMFPENVEFSMFYNILKSSVENQIDSLNKQLEEL